MFGYVRPLKGELTINEFNRYRAVYCGLCRTIGKKYGQLPRFAVTYDMTFLGLLLQALATDEPIHEQSGCVLHPVRNRTMAVTDKVLEACADFTVLLTVLNIEDNIIDGDKAILNRILRFFLKKKYQRAKEAWPDTAAALEQIMTKFRTVEERQDGEAAGNLFGDLLGRMFAATGALLPIDDMELEALRLTGRDLGRWIYWLDAVDDWAEDRAQNEWNPLAEQPNREAAVKAATAQLREWELSLDRTMALLPYQRDGGILGNIILLGLPRVRSQVAAGHSLDKV
ncbi:MAG TPA: hypothetical protein GX717_05900 [Clostridiaceae bacterium]|nr:hypothetical protein [Clostridiaceae bacterium]